MSKVICDICGTAYPESSDNCPLCGCSRDFGLDAFEDEMLLDSAAITMADSSRQHSRKHKEIFDFDEVNQDDDETEAVSYEDEDRDEREPRSNMVLVVILLVLIVLLLVVSGFVFLRYFLPNMVKETEPAETMVATAPVETEPPASTDDSVPCTDIVIPGGKIELGKDGKWLMNVQVYPADTTDVLTYVSYDENIATVTGDGTVTAVGEGNTVIEVTCGNRQIKCNVVVDYSLSEETQETGTIPGMQAEETNPDDPTGETTEQETEAADSTEPETEVTKETTGKTELKLKKDDITLFAAYDSAVLELDCDIPAESIKWFTMDSNVAIVHNGKVTATGSGMTRIYAEYDGQQVQCIVRCTF